MKTDDLFAYGKSKTRSGLASTSGAIALAEALKNDFLKLGGHARTFVTDAEFRPITLQGT